jgi:negative regulator of sigma E activity
MRSVLSHLNLKPQVSDTTFMPPAEMLHMAKSQGWTARDIGTDAVAAQKDSGLAPPRAGWLPDGFELDGYGVHHCPPQREMPIVAALARYTDGINTLTVFAMTPEKNAPQLMTKDSPRSCDFGPGTMVSQARGAVKLVAVGDLPPVTLNRVLEHTELAALQHSATAAQ